jgi:5-deoxy-glucuronate isomerase
MNHFERNNAMSVSGPPCKIYNVSQSSGHQSIFQPGKQDIHWLGLEILRLDAAESWQGKSRDRETAVVILSGLCTVTVRKGGEFRWEKLGGRDSIFGGPAAAVYVPRMSEVIVAAESRLEIAIVQAPCEVDLPPVLIPRGDVKVLSAGAANWRRDVRLIIPPGSPISQRLVIGETINPTGNWSGVPPHKHDEISATENFLEEFYFYKTQPANGYGVQLVYGEHKAQAQMIGNDDVMVFPNGYHPTIAAPGTTLGYLWALAGLDKAYKVGTDPRFDWVGNAETVIKEMKNQ